MHEVHKAALWPGRRRGSAVWGGLLGEQAMSLVRLSRQAGAHTVRVQVFEQAQASPGPGWRGNGAPWWLEPLRGIAQRHASAWRGWRWLGALQGPLALAWPQAQCRQGVLAWPGSADAPALQAEVHLEAAEALGLPTAEVVFDFQAPHPASPVASPVASAAPSKAPAPLSVHWAAAARAEVLGGQRQLRAAGWRVVHLEPEALAARRAAECLLGEPTLPWAVPVRDWQFASRAQRSVAETSWRALQDSPHWGALAACGAALALLAGQA